jgi:hypothetical protein
MKLTAKLLENPEVSGKVTLWDPFIGVSYRKPLGKEWQLHLHGDGGGFGAGSEVTYSGNATLDWRFAHHIGLSFGYKFLHFEASNTTHPPDSNHRADDSRAGYRIGIYF